MEPQYLSAQDIADTLNVSRRTANRIIKKLAGAVLIGKLYRAPRASLDAYLASCAVRPPPRVVWHRPKR